MEKLRRVVFYIRVSTEEQKLHGLSLDAQRMKLEEYAKEHDLIVVGSYVDEGVSGRKPIKKRPELQRMLKDATKDMFDLIIFIKLDRYFRSVAEYHECQKILDLHGIKWAATEEKYDLTTANGRAFINMKLTIAELEADQTGERIKLVNEYKVREGYALSGAVPFGWIVKRNGNHSVVIKDPEREHIVYELLDYFETHRNIRNSIDYISDKYGLTHTYKVLRNTISTPLLYGYYRGNPNYCEAYIDKERYNKLQKIISDKNIRQNKNQHIYLFSSLIKCGYCGSTMTGNYLKPRNKLYYAYRCNSANRRPRVKCKKIHSRSETIIETYLLDNLERKIKEYIIKAEMKEKKSKPKKVSADSVRAEIDRLNFMFQKSRISVEVYDAEYKRLENKLNEIETSEREGERDLTPLKKLINSDFKTVYSMLDRAHKRAFWQQIIDRIVVTGDKIEFEVKAEFLE